MVFEASDAESDYADLEDSDLSEWQRSEQLLKTMDETNSFMLEGKMKMMLDLFRKVTKAGCVEEDFYGATNFILKFFSRNSTKDEPFLLDGLNDYLNVINQNFDRFVHEETIGKACSRLEVNQESPLFQKSSQYWHLLYNIMKAKSLGSVDDGSGDVEILGILVKFNLKFIENHHRAKRPLATEALMVLQRMHDYLEEHWLCSQNEMILLFYFNELLDNSKNIYESTSHNSTRINLIVENTKNEIVRLLKCLFGLKFTTVECNHPNTTRKGQIVYPELADKIMTFYVPKNLNSALRNNRFDEATLVEMCQKLKPSIEDLMKNGIREEFNQYFLNVQKFLPECYANNDGTMKKLDPEFKNFNLLISPCVKRISSRKRRSFSISNESRTNLSTACYILAHESFRKGSISDTLVFAKETLMFGQNALSKTLIAQVWLFIAKSLAKKTETPNFDVSRQYNEVLFGFYMSLFFDKENIETHALLTLHCNRLFLIHKHSLSPFLINRPKHAKILEALKNRFKTHISFVKTYIKNETNIARIASIVLNFLGAIQANDPDDIFIGKIEDFVETSMKHLSGLISQSDSCKLNKTSLEQLSTLNQTLESLYPSKYKDFNLLVKDLIKSGVNDESQDQQQGSLLDGFQDEPIQIGEQNADDESDTINKQSTSTSQSNNQEDGNSGNLLELLSNITARNQLISSRRGRLPAPKARSTIKTRTSKPRMLPSSSRPIYNNSAPTLGHPPAPYQIPHPQHLITEYQSMASSNSNSNDSDSSDGDSSEDDDDQSNHPPYVKNTKTEPRDLDDEFSNEDRPALNFQLTNESNVINNLNAQLEMAERKSRSSIKRFRKYEKKKCEIKIKIVEEKHKQSISELTHKNVEMEKELEEVKEERNQLIENGKESDNKLKDLTEQNGQLIKDKESLAEKIAELTQRIEDLQQQLDSDKADEEEERRIQEQRRILEEMEAARRNKKQNRRSNAGNQSQP